MGELTVRPLMATGVGILLATLTACGDGSSASPAAPQSSASPTPETFTASGTITLTDYSGTTFMGDTCMGTGGFDDMRSGTQVTVYDADGTAVALGELETGRTVKNGLLDDCVFDFTVEDIPAEHNIYSVEVSHRGQMKFTKDEASDLTFSLG